MTAMDRTLNSNMIARICGAVAAAILAASGAAAQPRPLPPLPADAPPPPPGHSLEGIWIAGGRLVPQIPKGDDGLSVPFNAEGQRILDARLAAMKSGAPFANASAACRPPGPPWQMDLNFPFEIHEVADRIEFIFEEYHGAQTIFLDPAKVPPESRYSGRSIGHWEGDTLVVDTIGILPQAWLAIGEAQGVPSNGDVHVVERIRLADPKTLTDTLTITAPHVLTKPWVTTRRFTRTRRRDFDIVEGVCLEGSFTADTDKDGNAVFKPTPRTVDGNRAPAN